MNQTKLLVIDDQLDNFDVVEALLASENYQLFYASSGTKAFSLLESMSPDLILLDVMMVYKFALVSKPIFNINIFLSLW
jgi:CheY-like chemotaxis protein